MKKKIALVVISFSILTSCFAFEWKGEGVSFMYESGNPQFIGGMITLEQQAMEDIVDCFTWEETFKFGSSEYSWKHGDVDNPTQEIKDGFYYGVGINGIFTFSPINFLGLRVGVGMDITFFNDDEGTDFLGNVGLVCGLSLFNNSVVSIVGDVIPSIRTGESTSFCCPINIGIRLNNYRISL